MFKENEEMIKKSEIIKSEIQRENKDGGETDDGKRARDGLVQRDPSDSGCSSSNVDEISIKPYKHKPVC